MFIAMLLSIGFFQNAVAQQFEEEEPPKEGFDKSKLFFGGNFGVSFGSGTYVNISPQVGYRFSRLFAAGTGVNFNYSSYKYYDYYGVEIGKEEYGYAGLSVFGRVYPISFLLLQAQPELNYSWGSIKYSDNSIPSHKQEGRFVPSFLLGAGAAIPTGPNGALLLMLQYDVIQDARSPYGSKTFFTMGYNF